MAKKTLSDPPCKRRRVKNDEHIPPMDTGDTGDALCVDFNHFKEFLLTRAYDIITEGRFKKYFIKSKEASDKWALSTQQSISRVQNSIKDALGSINNVTDLPGHSIKRICDMVVGMQLPLTDANTESGTCAITGMKSHNCINICPKVRGAEKVLINGNLKHFFGCVWFLSKLDYVIRNYTRCWIEDRDGTENIQALCQEFEKRDEFLTAMFKVFEHSVSHIKTSITQYENDCKTSMPGLQDCLQAPVP